MKTRSFPLAVVVAATLVQCQGSAAPVPGLAAAPVRAGQTPSGDGKAEAPGPAVGAALPAFEAPDQDGRPQTFETLRGPNGLLLNFNRSVLW
jgi:hypothetical protein